MNEQVVDAIATLSTVDPLPFGIILMVLVAVIFAVATFFCAERAPGVSQALVMPIGVAAFILVLGTTSMIDTANLPGVVSEAETAKACETVLAAITEGNLRYVSDDEINVVKRECGTGAFLTAANAPKSKFLKVID